MVNYGEHAECKPPMGCCSHCPYREKGVTCKEPHSRHRGRYCPDCGVYVRGDDNS